MLMCITASLVGVIVLIRKRSLVGETLSHAAYPGVVVGAWLFACFFSHLGEWFSLFLLVGAFISSLAGLLFLHFLERYVRVKNDAALCFVLSSFFGVGILLASRMQYVAPLWYKQIQALLYGQPATMTDVHIWIYAALSIVISSFVVILYRQIQLVNFDSNFAFSIGLSVKTVETLFFCLLVLAVTVAIRGVGVVLLSGMLVAPALAARQLTHTLSKMFGLAAFISAFSAFLGVYLSVKATEWSPGSKGTLPIGPLIVLISAFFCFLSLFFAPKRGLFFRYLRKKRFSKVCAEENILKVLWKAGEGKTFRALRQDSQKNSWTAWLLLRRLKSAGWLFLDAKGHYILSKEGQIRASRIVRLHRLWEVYLVHLGQCQEKVHASAEEMEHVITPELEERLTEYLNHPKLDPHLQPIPTIQKGLG
jgi:manganese/zinc/iron transport system permease protein